jgi:hypothetical protein
LFWSSTFNSLEFGPLQEGTNPLDDVGAERGALKVRFQFGLDFSGLRWITNVLANNTPIGFE